MSITPLKYAHGKLILLDQRKLPGEELYMEIRTPEEIYDAIKTLAVRGAPAIGVAAAYGYFLALKKWYQEETVYSFAEISTHCTSDEFMNEARRLRDYIDSARPTAVNLRWALDRIYEKLKGVKSILNQDTKGLISETEIVKKLLKVAEEEAKRIHEEDVEACYSMGEYGLSILKKNMGILTHCNAGTIATSKYGTCLAPLYLGHEQAYNFHVFADETRPLLQGARLTSWELSKAGIDVTLICDNMAASVMQAGKIDAVVVGCDRMAANGDGANKIGTLGVAILAKRYNIPFYMFVPTSTIDLETATGEDIIIEERDGEEIYKAWYEKPMAPEGVKTFNPSFDITDAELITAVITEEGIVYPPFSQGLKEVVEKALEKRSK
ncbi:S-methyl-5-thioribose-1-phosphate isomerase [Eubacteriales bacterium KG127]